MNAQCAFRSRAVPGLTRPPARDIRQKSTFWASLARNLRHFEQKKHYPICFMLFFELKTDLKESLKKDQK